MKLTGGSPPPPKRFKYSDPLIARQLHPVLSGEIHEKESFTPAVVWLAMTIRRFCANASTSRESRLRVAANSAVSSIPNRVNWHVTPAGRAKSLGDGHAELSGCSATFAMPLMPSHDELVEPRSK